MLHALVLIGATNGVDVCAPFRARAAALGPVSQVSSTQYELVYRSSKAWRGGRLSYSYTRDRQSTIPSCYDGVIGYDGPRFSFGRDSTSLAALAAVYGQDAVNDFARAELTSRTYVDERTKLSWYRGRKYGYTIASGSQQLTVKSPDGFDADYMRATVP
jgi:hypothetical protein